jgi:DNA-binding transcriptional regulator YdaS (Cro superfamily)
MMLHDYFQKPGSLSVAELRIAINAKSDAQVRQWRFGYAGRKPGPAYCVAIERETNGLVSRQDLRPDDWLTYWPELATPAQAEPKAAAVAVGEGV